MKVKSVALIWWGVQQFLTLKLYLILLYVIVKINKIHKQYFCKEKRSHVAGTNIGEMLKKGTVTRKEGLVRSLRKEEFEVEQGKRLDERWCSNDSPAGWLAISLARLAISSKNAMFASSIFKLHHGNIPF